jgi:putative salt-induced outer membrane protein YdiY
MLGFAGLRPALADSVTLSDGSILFGTVKGLAGGKLTLETDFAGSLEIDATKIRSIKTEQPINVALASGDRLVGAIEPNQAGDGFVVKTKHADVPIKSADVQDIWTKDGKSPEQTTLEAEIAKHQAKWSATIEAGAVMKEGNTDSLTAHGAFELRRAGAEDMLKFYLRAGYAEQDDVRNQNEIIGGVDYEAWFTERWSWYTRLELEYDEFENLDLRTTAAAGLGYHWLKQEKLDLKTRAGVGYVHEAFSNGVTDDKGIIDLGLAFRWDIVDYVRFTHDANYSPSFDGIEDYRLRFDSAFTFPLGDSDRWKFKVGMLNEYDSMPEPGVERLDNTYYTSFVLDVK